MPSLGGIVVSTLVTDVDNVVVITVVVVVADHAPSHRVGHVGGEPDRGERAGRQRRRVRARRAFVLGALVAEVQEEARHQDRGQAGGRGKGIKNSVVEYSGEGGGRDVRDDDVVQEVGADVRDVDDGDDIEYDHGPTVAEKCQHDWTPRTESALTGNIACHPGGGASSSWC